MAISKRLYRLFSGTYNSPASLNKVYHKRISVILVLFTHSLTISAVSFCAPIPLRWKTTPSIPLIRGTA